jgi:microcompartment protein CcmK/EutM
MWRVTDMRIAEVIGTVTLSRVHPTLIGARWVVGVPFTLDGLREGRPDGEDLVIFEPLGAGEGARIGFSEGAEAAAPFHPRKKPVDAYCACILDHIAIS